jgi:uncharacterized protein YjaG (DUF416 family)
MFWQGGYWDIVAETLREWLFWYHVTLISVLARRLAPASAMLSRQYMRNVGDTNLIATNG